jgi:hypothetical protein
MNKQLMVLKRGKTLYVKIFGHEFDLILPEETNAKSTGKKIKKESKEIKTGKEEK